MRQAVQGEDSGRLVRGWVREVQEDEVGSGSGGLALGGHYQ